MRKMTLITVVIGTIPWSCGKEKKGEALGLPQVKPPVERNAPNGIKSATSLWLQSSPTTSLGVLGSRFFQKGPTSIMDTLDRLDQGLASLDKRSQEDGDGKVPCLSEEAKSWTAKLPNGQTGTYLLQCYEELESAENNTKQKMAFGISGDYAYMVQLQDSSGPAPRTGSLVKAKLDGTLTEAWITMQKFDLSQSVSPEDYFFLNVKADDASKSFEFSVGGTGKGIGVDCGVRVRSNGTLIYGTGIFSSFGDRGVENCSGGTSTSSQNNSSQSTYPLVNLCVDANSMGSVSESQCESIKSFTVPELTHLGLKTTGKDLSSAIIDEQISGVSAFKPK